MVRMRPRFLSTTKPVAKEEPAGSVSQARVWVCPRVGRVGQGEAGWGVGWGWGWVREQEEEGAPRSMAPGNRAEWQATEKS